MLEGCRNLMVDTRPLAAGLLCICLGASGSWAQSHSTHKHQFGNAEKWSRVFDDPARDAFVESRIGDLKVGGLTAAGIAG